MNIDKFINDIATKTKQSSTVIYIIAAITLVILLDKLGIL